MTGRDGKPITADFQLAGGPSVLFDSVCLVVSAAGAPKLAGDAAAVSFVHDAFAHLKVIGHTPDAAVLLNKAGVPERENGIVVIGRDTDAASFVEAAEGDASGIVSPKCGPFSEPLDQAGGGGRPRLTARARPSFHASIAASSLPVQEGSMRYICDAPGGHTWFVDWKRRARPKPNRP